MRVAGVHTLEQANAYLEKEFLPWWNQTLVVTPAHGADAHRPLAKEHDLPAILSHVEKRQVTNDYTLRWDAKFYKIERQDVRPGLRKAWVRVELRLDGNIAVRFQDRYLRVRRCAEPLRAGSLPAPPKPLKPARKPKQKSDWMKNFSFGSGARLREAVKTFKGRE